MSDSPNWMKPSDVVRIRRRRSLAAKASPDVNSDVKSRCVPVSACSTRQNSIKRKNPFSCSSVEVKRLSLESLCLPNVLTKISPVNQCNENSNLPAENKFPVRSKLLESSLLNECGRSYLTESENDPSSQSISNADTLSAAGSSSDLECMKNKIFGECAKPGISTELPNTSSAELSVKSKTIPIDWSLRTKVRFVSSTPFCCSSMLNSIDQAQGTSDFVQCRSSLSDLQGGDESSAKRQFQRYLMFWMHPNIPWLSTFPKIVNSVQQLSNGFLISDEVRHALQEDWTESMNAAYQNIRTGVCSYVYVCCHHLTILFRAAEVNGTHMNAIITPTTKGLRESLKAEGIEFQLPLQVEGQTPQAHHLTMQEESEANSEGNEISVMDFKSEEIDDELPSANGTDGTDMNWLEDLGLDRKQYRSIEASTVKHNKDKFREMDHRPESTVLVEGSADVQALFNYLINCSSLIQSSGPQAGIPPTILSPVAFKGATLQSLKVRQGNILWPDAQGQHQSAHSIEITGPILPQSLAGFCRLFNQTQTQFTANFAIYEPTVPFNCNVRDDGSEGIHSAELFGPGVHFSSQKQSAVRDLRCEGGIFNWSVY